jgi:HSP20 family protein
MSRPAHNPTLILTHTIESIMKLARLHPSNVSPAWPPFDAFFRQSLSTLPAFEQWLGLAGVPLTVGASSTTALAVDVFEDAGHYYARFEVPGVRKEDAQVELEDRRLTVSVTRQTQGADGASASVALSRSLTVPEGIATEAISAKLENGLLTVTLPKEEARKPRVIELN